MNSQKIDLMYPDNVTVEIEYSELDHEGMDFDSEEDREKFLASFENDTFVCLDIIVSVTDKSGQIQGIDSLGQCIVSLSNVEDDLRDFISSHDMIETAKADLEANIQRVKELN